MDARHRFELERDRIDRTPAGVVGRACDGGDAAGALRWNDIGHLGGVVAEIRDQRVGRGVDGVHLAALRQRYPFDHSRIKLFPRVLEQALLGEGVLCVEDQQLRTRFPGLQKMRDEAGAFVGSRRAAEGVGGCRDHHQTTIVHGLELLAQQQGLLAGLPGVRHLCSGRFIVTLQRVETQIDAGGQHQPVVAERPAVGEAYGASCRIDGRCRLGTTVTPLAAILS